MIAQCLIGGYGWLQVKCRRFETYASIPLEARSCRTPRYSPPVDVIKLTENREVAPYLWHHP
jgi:hypothetical protein